MSKSQLKAVGLASLMVFSALIMVATVGPAGAANVDTETTVTSTQSDLTSSTTVSDYNGTDPGTLAFEANVTTQNDSEVHVIADGIRIHKFSNDELNETGSVDTGTDGNADAWYKRLNSSQVNTALQKVPMRSGENKTVTVRAIDNATLDQQNRTYVDANITVDNTAGRIIVRGDTQTMSLATVSEFWGINELGVLGDEKPTATLEQSDVAINGSGTTYNVVLTNEGDNTSISERFSEASSNTDSGDLIKGVQLQVNGNYHPVYDSEAGDLHPDGATYGVYDANGDGEVTVNIGDEYDDADSVDTKVVANDVIGPLAFQQNFGALAGVPFVGAFALFVVTPYGVQKLREDDVEA